MPSNTTRPTQGEIPTISIQDANQLDGTLFDLADRHAEQPDARNPERLRVIATTLADVSAELDGIADTLAAGMEGRS